MWMWRSTSPSRRPWSGTSNASPRSASIWWSAPRAGRSTCRHVKSVVERHGIGLVWSPNYSVGVNAFFRIVKRRREAARERAGIRSLGLGDSPFGEERRAFRNAAQAGGRDADGGLRRALSMWPRTAPERFPASHEIGFDCAADTITLRHTARSREGFALGAIKAAEWVVGKKGFHEFGDILFREVGHVYRMRNGYGYAFPEGRIAR